jgi:hypothetical protein
MRGLCPLMPSVPVAVFCCHRSTSGSILPVSGPVSPCMSFVLQSDTNKSLLKRIASVANAMPTEQPLDELIAKLLQYDMVMINKKANTVLVTSLTSGAATDGDSDDSIGCPWDVFSTSDHFYDNTSAFWSDIVGHPQLELAIVIPEVAPAADGPR